LISASRIFPPKGLCDKGGGGGDLISENSFSKEWTHNPIWTSKKKEKTPRPGLFVSVMQSQGPSEGEIFGSGEIVLTDGMAGSALKRKGEA